MSKEKEGRRGKETNNGARIFIVAPCFAFATLRIFPTKDSQVTGLMDDCDWTRRQGSRSGHDIT